MHERLQTQRRSALSLAMTNTDFLRRKCACGIGPGADGECAECRSKKASLQRYAINQAEPSTVSPVVPAVLRSYGHSVSTTSRAFAEPCFGHNFSQVPVYATAAERVTAGSASGTVDRTEMPLAAESVDPEVDLLEDEAAMVVPPEPLDSLEKKPSCCEFTSFTASNDSYTDTDTDTRKNIRFTCSVKPGSAPKKCVMVNWVQGTAKNKDRTFRKAKVFDKIVDINFPKEQIDSIDKDPVWSERETSFLQKIRQVPRYGWTGWTMISSIRCACIA